MADAELGADRLQGVGLAVEAVAELQDPTLQLGQLRQREPHGAAEVLLSPLLRVLGVLVCEEIAELPSSSLPIDRLSETRASTTSSASSTCRSERPVASVLLGGWAPERRLEFPCGRAQLVPPLVDVRRHADRPRLSCDRALHRLADPPGGVGRELEALPVVELLRPD